MKSCTTWYVALLICFFAVPYSYLTLRRALCCHSLKTMNSNWTRRDIWVTTFRWSFLWVCAFFPSILRAAPTQTGRSNLKEFRLYFASHPSSTTIFFAFLNLHRDLDRAPNSNYQYAPATIKTHFNHVLCVVSPAPDSIPSQVEITAETTATTARSVPTTPRGTTSMGEEPEV